MVRPAIPESAAAVTIDWIQQALAAGGALDIPTLEDVVVESIGTGLGLLAEILRCHLTYHDGDGESAGRGTPGIGPAPPKAPSTVIVKLPQFGTKESAFEQAVLAIQARVRTTTGVSRRMSRCGRRRCSTATMNHEMIGSSLCSKTCARWRPRTRLSAPARSRQNAPSAESRSCTATTGTRSISPPCQAFATNSARSTDRWCRSYIWRTSC